jgi:hypothetical protein
MPLSAAGVADVARAVADQYDNAELAGVERQPAGWCNATVTGQKIVLRNPAMRWLAVLVIGFFAFGALTARGGFDRGLFLTGIALVLAYVSRARVILTEDGPVVVNVRRHSLAWTDIADVNDNGGFYGPVLTFRMSDGRVIRAWGVGTGRGGFGREWVRKTTNEIFDLWRAKAPAATYRDAARRLRAGEPAPMPGPDGTRVAPGGTVDDRLADALRWCLDRRLPADLREWIAADAAARGDPGDAEDRIVDLYETQIAWFLLGLGLGVATFAIVMAGDAVGLRTVADAVKVAGVAATAFCATGWVINVYRTLWAHVATRRPRVGPSSSGYRRALRRARTTNRSVVAQSAVAFFAAVVATSGGR